MIVTRLISLGALALCFIMLIAHFIRLVKLGNPKDLSEKSGSTTKGIIYSNTSAMLPQNKESAYMHLPTYSAGIIFHLGTFLSFLIFILSFFCFFNRWISSDDMIHFIIPACLVVSTACGVILFIKRTLKKDLKKLTNADDYLSNAFTTLFQLFTMLYLFLPTHLCIVNCYYIFTAILFLYMPIGKLKHLLYYFAARYHLGYFYGWRNVWPSSKKQ